MKEGYSLFHPTATFGNVGAGSVAIKKGGDLAHEEAREQMFLWLKLLKGNLLGEDLPGPEMLLVFLASGKGSEVILSLAEALQTYVQVEENLDGHTKKALLERLSQIKAQIEA